MAATYIQKLRLLSRNVRLVLVFTAISSVSPGFGTSQLSNAGPHGLSEMLYAFTSGTGNNGSAFAGISANTYWYNTTIGFATRPAPRTNTFFILNTSQIPSRELISGNGDDVFKPGELSQIKRWR